MLRYTSSKVRTIKTILTATIEFTGKPKLGSGQTCLTGRQACGVESAWRANPEMQIRVHINENKNATPDWDHHFVRPGRVRSCVLNYLLSNLSSNIQLLHADFTRDFLSSSSFWPLRKELEKSSWSTVHLSDAIRLILLQRYGGYYLDFDNIVLRPLHCLNNTLSYLEEAPNIENGIMILDAGHPFLQFLMDFSAKHYERNNRVSLGPPRVGQAFLQFCNTSQFGRFNLPVPTLFSHQPNSPGRILPN